ncbi:unnamed protein product, partial [Larinioides sclopetarius]
LGDFTFIRQTSSHIRSNQIGLPKLYHPPETSRTSEDDVTIDGQYFDLWSYGMMSLELLTRFHIGRSFPFVSEDARYACIRNVLQMETFFQEMQAAFPA